MNAFKRLMAQLERARKERAGAPDRPPDPALLAWQGRKVVDPSGLEIGHVTVVRLDGVGGAWLEVAPHWGVLDWLFGMGAGQERFTFHSDDVEARGERELVLRARVLDDAERAAG